MVAEITQRLDISQAIFFALNKKVDDVGVTVLERYVRLK